MSSAASISDLLREVDRCMLADRHRLRRKLRDWQRKAGGGDDESLLRLAEQVSQSSQRLAERQANRPQVAYDGSLPVHAHAEQIAESLRRHQVLVVCGETGSGKSTQLPKICLEAGFGVAGMIGHTQPRRIAARSIAARIAQELRRPLGDAVGFKVRFSDETGPNTYVKLMTDGVLLAETQHDRFLNRYDVVILDEAHERSLNIDFLLGYLHRLLPQRPELRLIITSATIDVERFCAHFASDGQPAPLVEVSGRTYPVEVRHRPPEPDEDGDEPDPQQVLAAGVEEACGCGPGDVLVFLPTERDIRDAARTLRGWAKSTSRGSLEILPLYARLSTAEQQRVFQPHRGRRIVLATNVAESSLTVPGIRYVVDAGTARISRYAARSKVQRLPIERVSQASAEQRKGRCGRVGPGVCIRLYSEQDYLSREQFTTPEIRRTNLASVVLQTEALKLGAVDEFPFLEPPRPEAIREAYKTLFELGAVAQGRRLTELGRRLSRLPVDPRIGRMVVAAHDNGCLSEVLVIAAALELPDPRQRPVDKQQAADEAHAQHAHAESDFFALLNLWDFYHDLRSKLSRSQLRKALQTNFLSPMRMQEWIDIHRQLRQLAAEVGMKPGQRRDDYEAVHRALLTGLLSNVAHKGDGNEYQGPGGAFHLWPGSGVFKARPSWVMAAELVETSRRFLRTVARIQPGWIEPAAKHLVKRSHSDPHWSDKSGAAMTYEKVTLYGLTVSARRRVPLAPLNPTLARELLIQHGLAESRLRRKPAFLIHNEQVVEEVVQRAARARQRELLVHEGQLAEFYEQRLPEDVCDPGQLDRWLKQQQSNGQRPLHMQVEDLIEAEQGPEAEQFPDQLHLGPLDLPVDYRFQPGEDDDGVSIAVPVEALNQIREERIGWLVPGLLEEKVLSLIRSLPKSLRRSFVPAPDTARRLATELAHGEGDFLEEVARALSRLGDEPVQPSDFRVEKLPPHLQLHIRVVDDRGQQVAASRSLQELREQLGAADPAPGARAIDDEQWRQDELTAWTFGELPEQVLVRRGGVDLPAFPALLDRGDSVGIRLLDSRDAARRETRYGVRRLFVLAERKELASQVKWLPGLERIAVLGAGLPDLPRLRDELLLLLGDLAFFQSDKLDVPRSESEFLERCRDGRRWVAAAAQDLSAVIGPLLENYHEVRLRLEELRGEAVADAVEDVRAQLQQFVGEGFLSRTPWQWLQHLPRYLGGAAARLDKLRGNLTRDRQHQQLVRDFWQRWSELPEERQLMPEFEQYRWMIEELRVSLFAQELGTSQSISPQRLEKQWLKAQKSV